MKIFDYMALKKQNNTLILKCKELEEAKRQSDQEKRDMYTLAKQKDAKIKELRAEIKRLKNDKKDLKKEVKEMKNNENVD